MKKNIIVLFLISNIVFGQKNVSIHANLYNKVLCDKYDKKGFIFKWTIKNESLDTVYWNSGKNIMVSLWEDGGKKQKNKKKFANDFSESGDYISLGNNISPCWLEVGMKKINIDKEDSLQQVFINIIKQNFIPKNSFPTFASWLNILLPKDEFRSYEIIDYDIYKKIKQGKKFYIQIDVTDKYFPLEFLCNKSILFPSSEPCEGDIIIKEHPKVASYEHIKINHQRIIIALDIKHLPKKSIRVEDCQ